MSYKVPVVQRDDYTIYFQDIDGSTWVHCDVRNWSPAVARSLKRDADTVYGLHGGPVFALNEPAGCMKHRKFLGLMGFKFLKECESNSGPQYIFKR